jgi:hypothetical protein
MQNYSRFCEITENYYANPTFSGMSNYKLGSIGARNIRFNVEKISLHYKIDTISSSFPIVPGPVGLYGNVSNAAMLPQYFAPNSIPSILLTGNTIAEKGAG